MVGAGCKGPRASTTGAAAGAKSGASAGLLVTPTRDLHGRVTYVNAVARYAVLSFPLGTMPALGSTVFAYRRGLKVAELKVTGPQRDNNVVADIVSGDCESGDEIKGE